MNRRAASPAVAVAERGVTLQSAPTPYPWGAYHSRTDAKVSSKTGFIVPEGAKVYKANAVNGPANPKTSVHTNAGDVIGSTPSTCLVADVNMISLSAQKHCDILCSIFSDGMLTAVDAARFVNVPGGKDGRCRIPRTLPPKC